MAYGGLAVGMRCPPPQLPPPLIFLTLKFLVEMYSQAVQAAAPPSSSTLRCVSSLLGTSYTSLTLAVTTGAAPVSSQDGFSEDAEHVGVGIVFQPVEDGT
eukprot:2789036-Rhodomonas_salina.1